MRSLRPLYPFHCILFPSPPLSQRTTTGRARSGGAAEAVVGGLNRDIVEGGGIYVPDVEGFVSISDSHFEHLVEVTIKDFSEPRGIDRIATHEVFHRASVEGLPK